MIVKLLIVGGLIYFLARNIFKAGHKIGNLNANAAKKNTAEKDDSIDAEYNVVDDE